MIKVYYCLISDGGFEVDDRLLSDYRRGRLSTLSREHDRRRSMAAEWLLIYAAAREGFSAPLAVTVGEHGKPYIDGLHFSLSHSGDVVACAVSDRPVGLDLQQRRRVSARLNDRIAHPDDMACEPLSLWCDKEAVLKLLGSGLTCPMSSVAVKGDVAAAGQTKAFMTRRTIGDCYLSVASASRQDIELCQIKN